MNKIKKDKELDNLELSKSTQLSLFELFDTPQKRSEHSNTIEIYDSLPKYNWENKREYEDLSNAVVTRSCKLRDQEFHVTIKPAIIEKSSGKTVLMFPGPREELIEDALRKLAVSGDGHIIEGKAGVTFTLYQLQKELKDMGHGYNINEIKEGIQICRGATLECTSGDGETAISSSFFPMVGLTTRGDFDKKGGNARCYVQFNPMVNESIMNLTFRQYNYRIGMQLPSRATLARFIYKRMCHHWTQASATDPYTPSLISFLNQSPRKISKAMGENIRAMKNALNLLIENEVLSHFEANPVKDPKNGKRIADVRYVIWPHQEFVKEVMKANKQKNLTQLKAEKIASLGHDILEGKD